MESVGEGGECEEGNVDDKILHSLFDGENEFSHSFFGFEENLSACSFVGVAAFSEKSPWFSFCVLLR